MASVVTLRGSHYFLCGDQHVFRLGTKELQPQNVTSREQFLRYFLPSREQFLCGDQHVCSHYFLCALISLIFSTRRVSLSAFMLTRSSESDVPCVVTPRWMQLGSKSFFGSLGMIYSSRGRNTIRHATRVHSCTYCISCFRPAQLVFQVAPCGVCGVSTRATMAPKDPPRIVRCVYERPPFIFTDHYAMFCAIPLDFVALVLVALRVIAR